MGNIGSSLKEKREIRKLSLEAVNSATRIPKKFLAALEQDDLSGFPAEVYYLGSLRRYARYLGLDDNALVEAYKLEKANKVCEPVSSAGRPSTLAGGPAYSPGKQAAGRPSSSAVGTASQSGKPASSPGKPPCPEKTHKNFWPYFLAIIILISLTVYAWIDRKTCELSKMTVAVKPISRGQVTINQARSKTGEKKSTPAASSRLIPASTLLSPTPSAGKGAQAAGKTASPAAKPGFTEGKPASPLVASQTGAGGQTAKNLKLEIEAVDNAWIKVTSDGKTEYSATLDKGLKKVWFADDKFGLVVGYAPGVRVWLNGVEIDVKKNAKQDISEMTLGAENAKKR